MPEHASLERSLELRPLVVDHRVIGGVSGSAALDDHVLSKDPLEACAEGFQGSPGAIVARVGLELDTPASHPLECMAHHQQLRFDVDPCAPKAVREPGPADLDAQML